MPGRLVLSDLIGASNRQMVNVRQDHIVPNFPRLLKFCMRAASRLNDAQLIHCMHMLMQLQQAAISRLRGLQPKLLSTGNCAGHCADKGVWSTEVKLTCRRC